MNSLQDLNNYGNTAIEYEDARPAGVIFDREPVTQNNPITFDDVFYFSIPRGIEIEDIVNYSTAACKVIFSIISQPGQELTGSVLLWGAIPAGVTLTTVGQVYTFTGVNKKSDWDAIKGPRWNIPANYDELKGWYVQVEIEYFDGELGVRTRELYYVYDPRYYYDARLFTEATLLCTGLRRKPLAAALSSYAECLARITGPFGLPPINYFASATSQLINCPSFTDSRDSIIWIITITPSSTVSINTFTNTGTLGSFSVDSFSKVITISGTTAQVQDRLDNLYFSSLASIENTFTLTYVSRDNDNVTYSEEQIIQHNNLRYLGAPTATTYDEDVAFTLLGAPIINDLTATGADTYTYKVVPSVTAAISTMSVPSGGSFNGTTKELTITGNRSTVNSLRNSITVTPAADYATDITLTYTLTTPSSVTVSKTQTVAITANSAEITDIALTRDYWTNTTNYPFATTNYKLPQTGIPHTWDRTGIARVRTGVYSGTINRYKYGAGGLAINEGAVGRVVPPDPVYSSVQNTAYLRPFTSQSFPGNFTIETWFLESTCVVFDCHNSATFDGVGGVTAYSNNGLAVYIGLDTTPSRSTFITVWLNGTYRLHIENITELSFNWHHFAIVRNGSTVTVYLNGVSRGSFTSSETFSIASNKGIGLGSSKGSYFINGNPDNLNNPFGLSLYQSYFIDNFRISTSNQYTANFTPAQALVNQYSAFVADFEGVADKTWPPPQASSFGGVPLSSTQVTPVIVDVDATNPNYTIEFSCASGYGTFGTGDGDQTNNYSFTGTKTQCNAKFSQLQFRPTGSTDSTVTYTQKKNGVTQLTQVIPFNGTVGVAL